MEATRFDVALALYHYLTQYHAGQGSSEYRRLSRLTRYFKPSPREEFLETLEGDGYEVTREIYERLVGKLTGVAS